MQEVLEKILSLLEAQDAKIKALEAQLEAYGGGMDTLIECAYSTADNDRYGGFSERHRSKFEPYLEIMDKIEGGDSFRNIYEKSIDFDSEEGYDEDTYVEIMLTNIIETINQLKAVVPPEAQEALEDAEEAIVEAAIGAQEGEIIEDEIRDPAPDEWSTEELEKTKPEGRQIFR